MARAGFYRDWRAVPWDARRWPDFSPQELACKCGGRFCAGRYWHDPAFLDALQALRIKLGAPVIVNSGHRDPLWNAAVGGAPRSRHKTIAADIRLAGHDAGALHAAARSAGFRGFGYYRTFLHLDLGRPRLWWGSSSAREIWSDI